MFAAVASGTSAGLGTVLLLYPIVYIGLAGTKIVTALLIRPAVAPRGLYLAALGMVLVAADWVWYIHTAIVGQPTTGSLMNMVASVGYVFFGLGTAGVILAPRSSERHDRSPPSSFPASPSP